MQGISAKGKKWTLGTFFEEVCPTGLRFNKAPVTGLESWPLINWCGVHVQNGLSVSRLAVLFVAVSEVELH